MSKVHKMMYKCVYKGVVSSFMCKSLYCMYMVDLCSPSHWPPSLSSVLQQDECHKVGVKMCLYDIIIIISSYVV